MITQMTTKVLKTAVLLFCAVWLLQPNTVSAQAPGQIQIGIHINKPGQPRLNNNNLISPYLYCPDFFFCPDLLWAGYPSF